MRKMKNISKTQNSRPSSNPNIFNTQGLYYGEPCSTPAIATPLFSYIVVVMEKVLEGGEGDDASCNTQGID